MRNDRKILSHHAPKADRRFPSGYGHGMPLDLEAFRTRIFRHARQGEEAVAFVVAPAFLWKGKAWKDMSSDFSESVSKGPIYTIYGVYSLDAHTLTDWTERKLMHGSVRIFIRLLDALDYADRVNQTLADAHFEDLQAGRIGHIFGWQAEAVDMFRVARESAPEMAKKLASVH